MEYGLIGANLVHSYSKIIHEMVAGINYELTSLNEEEFLSFMEKKEFKGINVTIPYKQKVIPYLNEIDEEAKAIGAVNVIINNNGSLKGYNTDAFGFKKMLDFHHIDVRHKKVLILGTGGTSKTIKHVLISLHAKEIYFVSRENKPGCITYEKAMEKFDTEVIINATPSGMYPHEDDAPLINLDAFPYLESVVDVIYNPFRTNLIIKAKEKGCRVATGLFMLVAQAVKALELFLNTSYEWDIYRKTYYKILLQTANIVFIGMPASGKTSASNGVGAALNIPVFDSDKEIEKDMNMTVREIFEKYGEDYFRDLEAKKIKELSLNKGIIISTGGGSIVRKENAEALMRNGYVIFLNRDIQQIKDNSFAVATRPILEQENAVDNIYAKRYPLYRMYADYTIENNGPKAQTLAILLKHIS